MYPEIMSPWSPQQRYTAVEAAFACATGVFAGFEKTVQLNVQTARTIFAEQQAVVDALFSAASFSEALDLQSQQFPAAIKKVFAYWRHVDEITAETGRELFGAAPERFGISWKNQVETAGIASAATAQEHASETNVLRVEQPPEASVEPGSIVDRTGNAISSNGLPGDAPRVEFQPHDGGDHHGSETERD